MALYSPFLRKTYFYMCTLSKLMKGKPTGSKACTRKQQARFY